MKKHFILVFILVLTFTLLGCSNNDKKVQNDISTVKTQTQNLKNSLLDLLSEKDSKLKIKIGNGSSFEATQYMTSRVMEMLKRATPAPEVNSSDKTECDVRLTFNGFKDINLNSKTGQFWFNGETTPYTINSWSNQYFKRAMLKEVDGQVMYDSFEKDILKQDTETDVDNDGHADDIKLYYDGDIRLKVKDQEVPVSIDIISDAISSNVSHNMYTCNLYVKGTTGQYQSSGCQFLVGITYSFVNKYGSSTDIKCFEYINGALAESSSTVGVSEEKINVLDIKDNNLRIMLGNKEKIIKLDDEETSNLKKYINEMNKSGKFKWDDIGLYFPMTTQYKLLDYDNDGVDELITMTVLSSGFVGIHDILYSIYTFMDEGVKFKDSFFASCNNSLEKLFFPG